MLPLHHDQGHRPFDWWIVGVFIANVLSCTLNLFPELFAGFITLNCHVKDEFVIKRIQCFKRYLPITITLKSKFSIYKTMFNIAYLNLCFYIFWNLINVNICLDYKTLAILPSYNAFLCNQLSINDQQLFYKECVLEFEKYYLFCVLMTKIMIFCRLS